MRDNPLEHKEWLQKLPFNLKLVYASGPRSLEKFLLATPGGVLREGAKPFFGFKIHCMVLFGLEIFWLTFLGLEILARTFVGEKWPLFWVTFWAIGFNLGILFSMIGLSWGVKIWPHSHLPVTDIPEYPQWGGGGGGGVYWLAT